MLDFYIKLNALPLAIYYPNSIGYFTKSIDLNGLKSWLNAYTKSAPFERLKVKCNEMTTTTTTECEANRAKDINIKTDE